MSRETAERLSPIRRAESPFVPENRYGYVLNVNHPAVRPLYERYKQHVGEHILSDGQRLDFERRVLMMWRKKRAAKFEGGKENG